jgi:hypothetical protein
MTQRGATNSTLPSSNPTASTYWGEVTPLKVLVGLNICVDVAKAIEEGELDLATARLGALRTLAAELDNSQERPQKSDDP